MKKKLTVLLTALLLAATMPAAVRAYGAAEEIPADAVEINAQTFPDEVFRNYVSGRFDTNRSGRLESGELANAKEISLSDSGVGDLTGVQYFTSLTELVCSDNQMTKLDVSKNTALENLDCSCNALTSLDVSSNRNLTALFCGGNQLSTIDLSRNTGLQELSCEDNQLSALNLSANSRLTSLDCSHNQLMVLNLGFNSALWSLDCSDNRLGTLSLASSRNLWKVVCSANQLTGIDVTGLGRLAYLDCRDNAFTSIAEAKGWEPMLQEGDSFLFYPQEKIGGVSLGGDEIEVKLSQTAYSYNGSSREPVDAVVYRGNPSRVLERGVHYTVVYRENIHPGIAAAQIKAIEGSGFVGSRTEYFTITPPTPALLSVSSTASGVTIAWKPVKYASSYRIYRRTGSGKFVEIGEADGSGGNQKKLSYRDTGVTRKNGVSYFYTVSAVAGSADYGYAEGNYNGDGLRSVYLSSPALTRAANSSSRAMSLKWKKNSKAGGYEVQYAVNSSYRGSKKVRVKGASAVSRKISKLKKGKKYYVRVRAWKTVSGETYYSSWSSSKSLRIKK